MARITYGPGNEVNKPEITHTSQIGAGVFAFFGASRENSEFYVNGAPYTGPLTVDSIVDIRQKANAKA